MASMTRVDSGSTVTYTITDWAGSTLAVAVTVDSVLGNTFTCTSSGGLHYDGQAMLGDLIWPLATGLLPQGSVPAF